MSKEQNYINSLKPKIKRLYELERKRKELNKEWRELVQDVKKLNLFLLQDENYN